MDESIDPAGHGPTRRWLLGGALAALVGGGAGIGAGFAVHRPADRTPAPRPPAVLVDAIAAEARLIADLDATTGGTPRVRQVIVQARSDHADHLRVLRALVATYGAPAVAAGGARVSATPRTPGTPRTVAQLRSAEQRASAAAAGRAAALHGPAAALLASICACEATHAELFG